ncbi:MAG TPA: hypothetical protein VH478_25665 [Trebonia sp.]|jgi:hypothetical protein|nr:hypothetical protein [Trebonia sp.]
MTPASRRSRCARPALPAGYPPAAARRSAASAATIAATSSPGSARRRASVVPSPATLPATCSLPA